MVTIKGKIRPIGNSYHILIPKALVKCEALPLNKELQFKVIMPLMFNLVRKLTILLYRFQNKAYLCG